MPKLSLEKVKGKTLPKKPTKKPPTQKDRLKTLTKDLDVLWSKVVHKNWGEKCGWPGCVYPNPRLSSHHWMHRAAGNRARWNTNNGILLCYFHHLHEVHQRGNTEPIRDALIEKLSLGGFERMMDDCRGVWKPTIEELEQLKSELSNKLEE
jgi:hypothetical protein